MKQKTNEQRIAALLKDNHPVLNALLVERILCIVDLTVQDIETNAEGWENPFVHPDLYKQLQQQVYKHLKP
jgi:hypothetical protein